MTPQVAGLARGGRPAVLGWDENAPWLLGFADLMLLMLCAFVILVVVDDRPAEPVSPAPPSAQALAPSEPVEPDSRASLSLPSPSRAAPLRVHRVFPSFDRTEEEFGSGLTRVVPPKPRVVFPTLLVAKALRSRRPAGGAPIREAYTERTASEEETNTLAADSGSTFAVLTPQEHTGTKPSHALETGLRDIFDPAGNRAEILIAAGTVTVRLREAITFHSGSAELLPSVGPALDRVARLLLSHPMIRAETSGHTDDVPIATTAYPSNWELSAARAAAVARYLLESAPIDPQRIKITGYGAHQPVDDQLTAEARARNRRVEIRFTHLKPPPENRNGRRVATGGVAQRHRASNLFIASSAATL